MPLSPADREFALQIVYVHACVTTWLAWDTVIHLGIEIECIWKRSRSWVQWAYIFVRYVPILHGGALLTLYTDTRFSEEGCRGWGYEQLIFMELLTFVVEAVLVIRLYALYNQNKVVLWMIILAFIAEVALMVVCVLVVLPKVAFSLDKCMVVSVPDFFITYWMSSLAFETFLFVLTLWKFFESISRSKTPVIFIFVRDGTWAFALIFVAMLLNTLMYKLDKTMLVGVGYSGAFAAMSFAGSHVLLNLRRLALPANDGTDILTAIVFKSETCGQLTTAVDSFEMEDSIDPVDVSQPVPHLDLESAIV